MKENNDIATEIGGTNYCEVCETINNDVTHTISLDMGDVQMCIDCLTEDATREEANTAALQRGDYPTW